MLQSKAGIENKEYKAQRLLLADVDAGKLSKDELFARGEQLLRRRLVEVGATNAFEKPSRETLIKSSLSTGSIDKVVPA
jgi:hypothetical protein